MARWAYPPWDFDIVAVSVSPSTVEQGESVTATVSIKNTGSEVGTVSVYFGVQTPAGGPEYSGPRKIFDIPVGETRSLSWPYTPSAGTGQYWIDFDVYSPPETHMFDTTGFVHSLTVTSSASQSDPTATRSAPSVTMVTVEEGASQTFVANLYDPDCDLHATEWYLEDEPETGTGTFLDGDDTLEGCSASSSWTQAFPSEGTFEMIVQVYDSRYSGEHMDQTSWIVTVTSEDPGEEPQECVKTGNSLRFSGYDWEVKDRVGGPGPDNVFDPENVWCDANGHLHLKIENEGGVWTTAEVNTLESFGFGHYEFKVSGDALNAFHDRVVLGLFNYPPAGQDKDGWDEIDIEFSRWGIPGRQPGQFVVYPAWPSYRYDYWRYLFHFDQTATTTTHRFSWQSDHVTFESIQGPGQSDHYRYAPTDDFQRRIPQTPLPVHINLWLYRLDENQQTIPQSAIVGADTEIVIEDFSWHPEAMPTSFRLPLPLPVR